MLAELLWVEGGFRNVVRIALIRGEGLDGYLNGIGEVHISFAEQLDSVVRRLVVRLWDAVGMTDNGCLCNHGFDNLL